MLEHCVGTTAKLDLIDSLKIHNFDITFAAILGHKKIASSTTPGFVLTFASGDDVIPSATLHLVLSPIGGNHIITAFANDDISSIGTKQFISTSSTADFIFLAGHGKG